MATIEIEIAQRKYLVACRDGEEAQLQSAAALVDRRARDAAGALGSLGEARLLMFTALMLADDVKELQAGRSAPAVEPEPDPAVAEALEALAKRIEGLAEKAEAVTGN